MSDLNVTSASSAAKLSRELCEQCDVLFSIPGLHDIYSISNGRLKHSQLEAFEHRTTTCRFCRFLWEGDLIGASPHPASFRRLRDLVYPTPETARVHKAKKFPGSWVVIYPLRFPATGIQRHVQRQVDHVAAPVTNSVAESTFSLKQNNLDKFQRETTHASALPQTLQDAMAVTHRLGFEYLWIDALCIIQDSPEDKQREISQMHNIYQSAAVTIVAATASSVNQGFLNTTNARFSARYPTCSISMSFPSDKPNQPVTGTLNITPAHTQSTKSFPINARGWTYQEALLPPRLLVFGDLEPFLRCQTKEATTAAMTCIRYPAGMLEPGPRLAKEMKSGEGYNVLVEDDETVIDMRLEFRWPQLVEQYTRRELGVQEDRANAIAGVVSAMEGITGMCHYGVWRSCAVACLLWAVEAGAVGEGGRWVADVVVDVGYREG
ncbi:hypothetical protein N0V88_007811 [Collariella sp. IMI 366227]|nr:hypothetical protein N0V88_007811 [Collariella sp. IMI 366227]